MTSLEEGGADPVVLGIIFSHEGAAIEQALSAFLFAQIDQRGRAGELVH